MSANESWINQFVGILGGGAVGFLSSLLLEPTKNRFFRPTVQFDFPIKEGTDLQDSSTTAYVPLIVKERDILEKNQRRPLKLEETISIRCLLRNKSRYFTAESCRVFLTSIKTRENPNQEWKATEYEENNQVAWTEKQFEFEAVDIFPQTSRSVETLVLSRYSPEVTIRIQDPHFSFGYLFHAKTPKGKGWKFSFLAVGKNISPSQFEFVLESPWKDSLGVGMPQFQINGCPLEFNKLYFRNYLDPVAWENMGSGEIQPGGI